MLLSHGLPPALQNLFVFEDSNKILSQEQSSKRVSRSLGKAFSKATRSLENFSATFIIDAADFFADFSANMPPEVDVAPWKNLRNLVLTSRLLHPEIGRRKITNLLIAAGRAAAHMPKLESMEIWNGGEGQACIFRYDKDADRPRITWLSNWGVHVQLHWGVIYAWDNGANTLTTAVLLLPLKRKQVKTCAPAILHLKLRRYVLDAISDYQIFWEESREFVHG